MGTRIQTCSPCSPAFSLSSTPACRPSPPPPRASHGASAPPATRWAPVRGPSSLTSRPPRPLAPTWPGPHVLLQRHPHLLDLHAPGLAGFLNTCARAKTFCLCWWRCSPILVVVDHVCQVAH